MSQVRNYWSCVSVVFISSSHDIATGHFWMEWIKKKKWWEKAVKVVGDQNVFRRVKPQRVMAWCIISRFWWTYWFCTYVFSRKYERKGNNDVRVHFWGSNPSGEEGSWMGAEVVELGQHHVELCALLYRADLKFSQSIFTLNHWEGSKDDRIFSLLKLRWVPVIGSTFTLACAMFWHILI